MIIHPCINYFFLPYLLTDYHVQQIKKQNINEETQSHKIVQHTESITSFQKNLEQFLLQTEVTSKKLSKSLLKTQNSKYYIIQIILQPSHSKILRFLWQRKKKKKLGKKRFHRLSISKTQNPKKFTEEDWNRISQIIPFRNSIQCKFKWMSLRQNQLQNNPWSKEQIDTLLSIVNMKNLNGEVSSADWREISEQLFSIFKVYRTSKQCRQCWNIQIKSHHESKKLWTPEEDMILRQMFVAEGKKWKVISKYLSGRSQNAVKNRFNLLFNQGWFSNLPQEFNREHKRRKSITQQKNQMIDNI